MSGKRSFAAAALALAVSSVLAMRARAQDQTRDFQAWVNINGTAVQAVATPVPGVTVFSTGPTQAAGTTDPAPLFGTALILNGAAGQRSRDILLDNRQPVRLAGLNAGDNLIVYVTAAL